MTTVGLFSFVPPPSTHSICRHRHPENQNLTFRFPPATWTPGQRRRRRRRWSCWLLSLPPWPGRTSLFPEGQTGGFPAMESACLQKHTQHGARNRPYVCSSFFCLFFCANTCEQMREFDWEDDSFFQGFLGSFQSRNIVPLHIWFFHYNGTWKRRWFQSLHSVKAFLRIQSKNNFIHLRADFWISFSPDLPLHRFHS